MLMTPNKDETAVHGCHCRGDKAVRMLKVLAIPRSQTALAELVVCATLVTVVPIFSLFVLSRRLQIWRTWSNAVAHIP